MKKIAALSLSIFLGSLLPAHAGQPVAVVELFTSQGCSSCPPADAFLGKLSMRKDVLALAYHVDYWDYIGWDDVHAQAAFTERQRDYARAFRLRYVYTPQMVVSGRFETSGNQQEKIRKAISSATQSYAPIAFKQDANVLTLNGPAPQKKTDIVLVQYLKESTTEVRRGENRGKTLTDYHIVQSLQKIASWTGDHLEIDIQRPSDKKIGQGIFLQTSDNLEIIAAYRLD